MRARDARPRSPDLCAGAAKMSFEDSFNHQLSRARINIECVFGMLTRKFLIFGRPLPWVFFKSPTKAEEDFEKPGRLLRVAMKLHNACIDERLDEEAPHPSDFYGGYDTEHARANGQYRGQAETEPTMASGWAHPAGGTVPSWSDEDAAGQNPPAHVYKDKQKAREMQLTKVSAARVHLTDKIAQAGLLRPDPETVAQQIREAKRSRN